MTRRLCQSALLAAAWWLAGCCPPVSQCPKGPAGPDGFATLKTELDAGRWLAEATARARVAGAGDLRVIAVDAAAPGDRVGGMLRVPDDSCVLLLARAAPSVEDVDLFAYGDDGTVLGSDEAPDKTPSVLVCPPHPRRMYVVARVAGGHGLVAVGAQRVAVEDAQRVRQQLRPRARPGAPRDRFEAWPGLQEKLAERRRWLGSSWQDVRQVAVPADPRVASRISATVEADRCLDVLVVPSEQVAHLDVAASNAEGRILGRAGASGRDRALVICSPSPAPITIELRPHSGEGLVAVVLSRSAEGGRRDLDASALVFDAAPGLDLAGVRAKHAARLKRAGYGRAKVVAEGALSVGRRSSVPIELPAGCARIDLLAGRPVRGLQAWLWAEDGSLIARNRNSGLASVFACGAGGKVRLDAEALALPGRYVVELRREVGTPRLLQRHPLAASRLLDKMVSRGVIKRAGQVTAANVVRLTSQELQRVERLVPVRRCVDFTLALGPGASGAEIRLFDIGRDEEVALARGTYATSARACALRRRDTLRVRAEFRCVQGETDALLATRMLSPKR